MVDAHTLGTEQYTAFSYVNNVLSTTAEQEAGSGIKFFRAAPMSTINDYQAIVTNGDGVVGTSLPLDGTNIIAFEARVSGLGTFAVGEAKGGIHIGSSNVTNFSANEFTEATYMVNAVTRSGASSIEVLSYYSDEPTIGRGKFRDEIFGTNQSTITIGVYYNQNTRQVGFVSDIGGDYGYIPTTTNGEIPGVNPLQEMTTTTGHMYAYTLVDSDYTSGPILGDIQVEYRTNASDFALNYPAGAVDVCGNPI